MRIPYGVADFRAIREDNLVLVDKSRYIRLLESPETGSRYVAWLRPRRFGKSVLLSMLCAYYDLALKDQFERLFGELEIGQSPTPGILVVSRLGCAEGTQGATPRPRTRTRIARAQHRIARA